MCLGSHGWSGLSRTILVDVVAIKVDERAERACSAPKFQTLALRGNGGDLSDHGELGPALHNMQVAHIRNGLTSDIALLDLAGAGGIEPPSMESKIRDLRARWD
jgi:hypothetical protein